jgi:hypothetical protein
MTDPMRVEWDSGLRVSRGKLVRGGQRGQEVHAAAFLRERRLLLDRALLKNRNELSRIVVHELFHWAWLRLGNPARRSWESLLGCEFQSQARGELGWSAEWRKNALRTNDRRMRSRRWREYACESFCDTAAWLYADAGRHAEFTLAASWKKLRKAWFEQWLKSAGRGFRV